MPHVYFWLIRIWFSGALGSLLSSPAVVSFCIANSASASFVGKKVESKHYSDVQRGHRDLGVHTTEREMKFP